MRNKEQEGGRSVQGIAVPLAVGMISTKLSRDRTRLDEPMPNCVRWVQCGPSPSISAGAFLEIAGIDDYPTFADLERLKNDIHRCDRMSAEAKHTRAQAVALSQGAH
jgi:hypothetical protein